MAPPLKQGHETIRALAYLNHCKLDSTIFNFVTIIKYANLTPSF